MTVVARHVASELRTGGAEACAPARLVATWVVRGLVVEPSGPRVTNELRDRARLVVIAERAEGPSAPAHVLAHVEDDAGRAADLWRGDAEVVEDTTGRLVHIDAPPAFSATWRLDAQGQALYARTTLLEKLGVRAACGEVGRG